MIDPSHYVLDGLHNRHFGQQRAAQEDDGQAERSRRRDLAVARTPAAVFGDDDIDRVCGEQRPIVGLAEWTAAGDIGDVRHRKRRINRLDAAHEIAVLRRSREDSDLGLAEREKHVARRFAERFHSRCGIGHLDPAIAGTRRPGRAPKREQGDGRGCRGGGCVGRDRRRIGMRHIDQRVDAFSSEISRKALGAAESADPYRRSLRCRRRGAARERDRYGHIGAFGETLRQTSRFRGPAENEDAPHAAC